jgi:hypothetical protein
MNLSDRDKRILKIAGPVLAGILALFLVFNLLSGGDEPAAIGPVLPTGVTPVPTPTDSGSPGPTASPVVVFAGRDPFSIPPVFPAPTSTFPSTSSSVSTSTSTSPPTSPASPTPTPTTPSGGNSQDFTGKTIVLLDVFSRQGEDMAQVTVNSNLYTVTVGQRFAQNFELVSVSGSCANFLHVEESFTLCTNSPK